MSFPPLSCYLQTDNVHSHSIYMGSSVLTSRRTGTPRYIKQAAEILRDKYGGDIPSTIEGLTSLPGVGPKMAYLCMSAPNGWDRVEGIGVDVHVHRITNLWGWHHTTTPEATRLALQAWLPHDRWREINWLLVGLGQTVCLPVGRRCGDCELGLRGLCPAAERKKVAEGRRRRGETKVEEAREVKREVKVKEEQENEAEQVFAIKEEDSTEEKVLVDKAVKVEVDDNEEKTLVSNVVKEAPGRTETPPASKRPRRRAGR